MPLKTMPWIIGAAAMILGTVFALFGQASANTVDPNFKPEVTGAPRLEVVQDFFELGDQHYNIPVEVTYNLQNIGDQPLRILETPIVQVLEGCCPPTPEVSTMILKPGQRGSLKISFSMHEGMDGPHDFRIALKTNDPSQPLTELRVTSNWIP
jgi:hypothetical protein